MAANVKITSNTREFQANMRALAQELRSTDSALSLVSEKAKLFGSTTDILGAEVERLSVKLEGETTILGQQREYIDMLSADQLKLVEAQQTTEASLNNLNNERREAVAAYGSESEQVKALDLAIADLNKEYLTLERQLATTERQLTTTTNKANLQEASMLRTTSALDKANAAYTTRHVDAFATGMDNVSKTSGKVQRTLTPLALGIGAVGAVSAYNSIKFSDALAKLSTIANTGQVPLKNFKQGILDISKQTGISAASLSESAYQAISSGVSTKDALDMVSKSAKLSNAGFTSVGKSIDILTTIMNSYGLKSKDIDTISNDLIRTQNLGKTTVDQLASSMGTVIPMAKSTHVNLQQLSAAYVEMTSKGVSTAESGTMIKGMLSELSKHGSKSDEVLRKLTGTGFVGLMEKGKSVSDVLNILNGYATKNGLSLSDMFGNIRAGNGALILASDKGKAFNDILAKMNKKGNDTNDAFKKVSDTTGFKLKKSLVQLQDASIKLGDALTPLISHVSDGISSIAKGISKLSPAQLKLIADVGVGIVSFTLFMGVLSKVAGGLSTLSKGIGGTIKFFMKGEKGVSTFSKVLSGLSKPFKLIGSGFLKLGKGMLKTGGLVKSGVLKSFGALQKGASKSMSVLKNVSLKSVDGIKNGTIKTFSTMKDVTLKSLDGIKSGALTAFSAMKNGMLKGASAIGSGMKTMGSVIGSGARAAMGALKTLWATMLANPITIVIVLIAAIGIALVECYKHCAWFRNKVNWLWSEIKKIFSTFINFLKGVFTGQFSGAIGILVTPLRVFMQNAITIWNAVKGIFSGIIDFIKGVFTGNWSEAWNGVKEIFSSIFGGITGIANNVINGIKSAINFVIGGINKLSFTVPSWVPGIGGDHFGMHIPMLATGGVLDRPTIAMIGEDGQEAVMPLEKNTEWITQLASKIDSRRPILNTAKSNSSNNDYSSDNIDKVLNKLQEFIDVNKDKVINVPVILDGKEIARVSSKYNGKQQLLDRRMRGGL